MEEYGLMKHWSQWFRKVPSKCLANTKIEEKKKQAPTNTAKTRLSLKNLTGAFIVLLVGYAISLLTFFLERIANFISLCFSIDHRQ